MKQSISILSAVLLLLCAMAIPFATADADTAPTTTTMLTTTTSTRVGVSETSTLPLTTTTTWYDCISTTTTWPPTTTSTTLNLTGPDGTAPEYGDPTRTTGTTAAPSGELDLLTTARLAEGDHISVLSGPTAEYGFCADCYTNNGDSVSVFPQGSYSYSSAAYRYLHLTVNANVPFSVMFIDPQNGLDETTAMWFAEAMNSGTAVIAKGPYVAVLDLHTFYEAELGGVPPTYRIPELVFSLSKAGSISVGHIALSDSPICEKPAPAIQTTTIPSFPWWNDSTTTDTTTTTLNLTGPDGTAPTTLPTTTVDTTRPYTTTTTTVPVTTTRPTTNPTVGDVFVMGDMDADYFVTTADARMLLQYTIGAVELDDRALMLADVNYDGAINTADAREALKLTL